MSMLSRVAERVYWLGRYLERIENTARLVSVYGNVLLDLPSSAKLRWESLIAITGSGEDFAKRYSQADEHNVVRFYLTDRDNPTSIVNSADNARENARTVREMVPSSIWEGIAHLPARQRRCSAEPAQPRCLPRACHRVVPVSGGVYGRRHEP